MALVVRVRFKRASKLYDFDPNGLELHTGMHVVTETARGVELGECMSGVMEIADERVVAPLKPILRIATEQDMLTQRRNEESEREAFDIAIERIADHGLEMKLVDVEYAFDRSKIIFYFTANGRVDFRMLVKNLAGIFKTRIELRQIGVRDEAKMLGGIGPCGRPICCRQFLGDFTPVSIKMAKEQNLSLNPTKISGLCDRLMCCLKYEQDQYETTRKRMPRVGREIITPDGTGTINASNVLQETVRVRIAVGDSFELREYRIDDCQRPGQDGPVAQAAVPEHAGETLRREEDAHQNAQPQRAEARKEPRGAGAKQPQPRRERQQHAKDEQAQQQQQQQQQRQPRPERGQRPKQDRNEKQKRAPETRASGRVAPGQKGHAQERAQDNPEQKKEEMLLELREREAPQDLL